jgi:hypothetical protein
LAQVLRDGARDLGESFGVNFQDPVDFGTFKDMDDSVVLGTIGMNKIENFMNGNDAGISE